MEVETFSTIITYSAYPVLMLGAVLIAYHFSFKYSKRLGKYFFKRMGRKYLSSFGASILFLPMFVISASITSGIASGMLMSIYGQEEMYGMTLFAGIPILLIALLLALFGVIFVFKRTFQNHP